MPYLETLFWKLAIRIIKRRYSVELDKLLIIYITDEEEKVVEWIENHIKRINKNHNE